MDIAPIDLTEHSFSKSLRGYKPFEVDEFISTLVQNLNALIERNEGLRKQVAQMETGLEEFRKKEASTEAILARAREAARTQVGEANRQAQDIISEAEKKVSYILEEARKNVKIMLKEAEARAAFSLDESAQAIQQAERDFRAVEKARNNSLNVLKEALRNMNDTLERYEKMTREVTQLNESAR